MAETTTPKSQLRREMGLWDVLLFNIAAVLGPRWIAAAAHNGTSSISLWVLAAVLFFLPTALIIVELSTRYPTEGGLYIWAKEAFGEFHGFVAGWAYWTYTMFYFPGLLLAVLSPEFEHDVRASRRAIPLDRLSALIRRACDGANFLQDVVADGLRRRPEPRPTREAPTSQAGGGDVPGEL